MEDIYADACEIAADNGMIHATFTAGDPPRVTGRLHMPARKWVTFITVAYERLGMASQ